MRIKFLVTLLIFPRLLIAEIQPTVTVFSLNRTSNINFTYEGGLAFKKSSPYGGGTLMFYLLPSGEFSLTNGRDQRQDANIPHLAIAKLKAKKRSFEVTDRFPLYFEEPNKLAVNFTGVATAPEEIVWIADSKSNSLVQVDLATGAIKETISVSDGLPKTFGKQTRIQSIGITPNGKVYTTIKNISLPNKAKVFKKFVELIELDPKTLASRVLAIPLEVQEYQSAVDVISKNLQAVDNERLLMTEQIFDQKGFSTSRIYLINLQKAEDISTIEFNKQDLASSQQEIFGKGKLISSPARKELLVDLNKLGWKDEALVGLALVDAKTIALSHSSGNSLDPQTRLALINLPEPLYFWTWKEWALFLILGFILVFSTILTILFVFKGSVGRLLINKKV